MRGFTGADLTRASAAMVHRTAAWERGEVDQRGALGRHSPAHRRRHLIPQDLDGLHQLPVR
jgi:hypothetical protein